MVVAASDEHEADHKAREEKSNICELSPLRESHTNYSEALSYSRRAGAGGWVLFFDERADIRDDVGNVVVTEAFYRFHFAGAFHDYFFELGVGFLLHLVGTELGGLQFHSLGVSGGAVSGGAVANQTFIAVNGFTCGRVAGGACWNSRKHPGCE